MPDELVLDTSAIIAWFEDEAGADEVEDLVRKAQRDEVTIYVAFVSLMEADYIMERKVGREQAETSIANVENWPISVVESHPQWRYQAARIKARGGLSLADSWIASLALMTGAELVHKDKEFDSVPGLRSVRL